ncbi:MAG: uroporphyrinogen-III synthase, partial [Burkholderiales bacterium]
MLVTRPAHQSSLLAEAIRSIGGNPVMFPGVDIVQVPEESLLQAMALLPHSHFVIFVSPNAARAGMQAIATAGGLPASVKVAAVGPGTAGELKKNGVHEIIMPREGYDSESLAACPELREVSGKRILIVRGVGGRDELAGVLRARGAEVSFAECYRRARPQRDFAELEALWRSRLIAAWTATSAEIVDNLFDIAGERGRHQLCRAPLFVSHSRIVARAFRYPVETIFVTAPGDSGLVAGLATW